MKGCKRQGVAEKDEESEGGFEHIFYTSYSLPNPKLEITVTKIDSSSDLGKIHAELKYISDHMRQEDIEGDYESEWKYAATVFDR